jgi:hypothetical protein
VLPVGIWAMLAMNGWCRVAPQAELIKAQGPYCSISAFDRGTPSPTY